MNQHSGNNHSRLLELEPLGRGLEMETRMGRQLDILALEPFYGGVRRTMLESISRCSRHRWTILKLPARKIERRLMVAATWFSECLARYDVGDVDVLFTSEALNLAELLRLVPWLSNVPAIVYFHDNQLPAPEDQRRETPADLVNLTSAMAAGEMWFNSLFNLKTFLSRASGMVRRHPEIQARNPMADLTAKAQLVPPPIDMGDLHEMAAGGPRRRDPRSVLVDARGCDHHLISQAMARVLKMKERVKFTVIGRVKGLPESAPVTVLHERDEAGQIQSMLSAGVVISARVHAMADDLAVRALAAGCHPIVPNDGVYPELLPESMHSQCLHDGTAESMAQRLMEAWHSDRPAGFEIQLREILDQFDAIRACRNIDERVESMVVAGSVR